MKMTDQAKGTKGQSVKPDDDKKEATCPCNSFIQCSSRNPYGVEVWSDPVKSQQARGVIAYDGKSAVPQSKELDEAFDKKLSKNSGYPLYFKKLVANINKVSTVVLYMPEISEGVFMAKMAAVEPKLTNAGKFSDFQKSVILRANMVKNGLQKLTQDNDEGSGVNSNIQLEINGKGYISTQWNVDHIMVRVLGGCNRFCNAALLATGKNKSKSCNGNSCPCVCVLGKEESNGDKAKFDFSGREGKRFKLWNCDTFTKEKKSGNTQYVPDFPLGSIDKNRQICGLDNPMLDIRDRSVPLMIQVNKACKR